MQTVCSYCGVGCKFEVKKKKLKGVKNYPSNHGMACAKGLSLVESIDKNRLTQVKKRDHISKPWEESSYEESIALIAQKISQCDPKRVGFYLSGQMLNEDYYVANKLAKGFVGTPNCDTNSRTCMASAVVGYKKSFGIDYVPVRIDDIEHANLLILTGANPAQSHVVLFNKIKKAQKKGLKVVVIDPRETQTAQMADLYLPIQVGSNIDLMNLLAQKLIQANHIDTLFLKEHSHGYEALKAHLLNQDATMLLKNTGLTQEVFDAFFTLFTQSQKVITAWTMGINQSIQGVDKNLTINNLHILTGQIGKQGCGPFSLTGQPNAMGGREVGGLSTTLAVHLDYSKENCQKVASFWNTPNLPTHAGLTAFEMLEAAHRGELDVLIVCHTDPIYHLPNRHFVEEAMKRVSLVVEINAYEGSETSAFAHLQLPVKAFGEKEGTQTNMDRTLTRVEAFSPTKTHLQEWELFAKIAQALGYGDAFAYPNTQAVFEEYQAMTKLSSQQHLNLYEANYHTLKTEPFEWGEGLFTSHRFFTPDQKAHLHCVSNEKLSEQADADYPFILLTGRTRDQWHSGSKTAHISTLLKYKALTFVEMHPEDAQTLQLQEGEKVKVSSARGSIEAILLFSTLNKGVVFMPISHRGINYLTNSKVDPLSKEPDYNHSAVKVEKIDD